MCKFFSINTIQGVNKIACHTYRVLIIPIMNYVPALLHLMCCDVLQSGLLQFVSFTFLVTLHGGISITKAYPANNGGEESFIDYALRQRRKTTKEPATIDEDMQISEEVGVDSGSWYEYDGPRNETYNPHHGFEMYWPDGEWVLPEYYYPLTNRIGPITFNTAGMCGRPCAQKYKDYGPLCARNIYGVTAYDFENFCEFMNQDCERTNGWHIAYRGRCDRNPVANYYLRGFGGNWMAFQGNKADALMYNFMKTSPIPHREETTKKKKVAEIKD